jgi:hypothetical protein
MISRRNALVLLGAVVTAAGSVPARAQSQPVELKAVLELFTSQGCSSCPPADSLLQSLTERRDLITLTMPVDYWDYLGWKDTLASPRFTERQRAYAKSRGDGLIYTPQVVVNGAVHVNGASRAEIEKAVDRTSARFQVAQVPVKISTEAGKLIIETGARQDGAPTDATIWLAVVQRRAKVTVRKGENHGKELIYANVVRELTPIGMWSGKAETIRLDRQAVMRPETEACAVLVQNGTSGPIIGAAWLGKW